MQEVCAQMYLCSSARRLSDAPARFAWLATFSFSTLSSKCLLASAAAACPMPTFTYVLPQMKQHTVSLLWLMHHHNSMHGRTNGERLGLCLTPCILRQPVPEQRIVAPLLFMLALA